MIARRGGDHSPSSSKSGSVKQEWSTYSKIADSHTYETKKKHQSHDTKTAYGTTAGFFLPVENPPCADFYHANFTAFCFHTCTFLASG